MTCILETKYNSPKSHLPAKCKKLWGWLLCLTVTVMFEATLFHIVAGRDDRQGIGLMGNSKLKAATTRQADAQMVCQCGPGRKLQRD